ncbi:MAG: type II toxin-antitoxin system YafO family toxin [Saprospiraceae bacterium]|nr:type II toxin-antitoxin system YafO family toxin [Saprospiraceae bacterium]
MSKDIHVNVTYDKELLPLTEAEQFVGNEFKNYKIDSLSQNPKNFVTPNEYIQSMYPSAHSLFGRDRVFDYPKKWFERIDFENLAHVHFNIKYEWNPSQKQWSCTSDSSVVYSAFVIDNVNYHFVIHELLLNTSNDDSFDAHEFYKPEDLKYFLDNAEYHRKIITKKV